MKQDKRINDFIRDYAEVGFKRELGTIKLPENNKSNRDLLSHNLKLCEVCCHLKKLGIPFITEFKMKGGLRPDIVCPTHVKKIIEILHTETMESFREKKLPKYPEELKNEFIFIKTLEKFDVNKIM